MEGIGVVDQETLSIQLKSLMIFEFLNDYNKLEQKVRKAFEFSLPNIPQNIMQQLYFYQGGRLGTYIDYEPSSIKLNSSQYKENDLFRELTINQIIRIFKSNPCIVAFDFELSSINKPKISFPFYDCMLHLLSMRNKLAHEVMDLSFKNADLIELLTLDQLKKEEFSLMQNYDLAKMDDMTVYIASNIIYMRMIIERLD